MLTREQILGLACEKYTIETDKWGEVTLRQLAGSELEKVLEILELPAGTVRLAALVQLAAVAPAFEPEDIPGLARGPMEPLNKLANAILADSGLGEPEKKSSEPVSSDSSSLPSSSVTLIPTK